MNTNGPNYTWLSAWALTQVISVVLAMTIVSKLIGSMPIKPAICFLVSLVSLHWLASYGLLIAANTATDRPEAIASSVTAALLAVVLCPTEPRMAQTLAATVFLGIVLWQTILKFLEE